jgi:serine phosphatase RsbU (regulator of sigma subunit)
MTNKDLFKIYFISILLLLINAKSFAVEIDPVYLYADSLKEKPTTLSLPWKYHPGDNPQWALKSFDDSDWDTLKTDLQFDDLNKDVWTGIGWFRREIVIDSTLIDKSVGFSISHYGASEIYLNGKLVYKFGKVSALPDSEKVYQQNSVPIAIEFNSDNSYVLAIRYSNHKLLADKEWYGKWFGYAGFKVKLSDINDSIYSSVSNSGLSQAVNMGIAAIFLSLSFLYFLLFFFYSMKRENLYYSLFTFFISVTFASGMLVKFVHSNIDLILILRLLSALAVIWIFPSYLAFIYSIFYKKMPKQFWIFITAAIVLSIIGSLLYLPEDIVQYSILAFIALAAIEGLRTIIVAIKQKKDHSWVIGVGVIVFFIFIITLFTIGLLGMGSINSLIGVILFFIGLLSLPLSMSIYLARDIASTNKNLITQLSNVKELSKKELEQELRAQRAEAENERKTKELEEARQLQLSMLPKELPHLPNFDIAVHMQTATEVGGDYYDFHVAPDGTLTIVIGDATGHGMKAGTMVTAAKSIFNSYVNNPDIIFTFREFNRVIKGMQLPSMSMCLSLLKINKNQLTMSAAGMPHALLYRSENKKVEEIILKGMPLGAVHDYPYQIKTTELKLGDTLLLLSDGLPELFNSIKEMFGYERVITEYEKVADKNPKEIINHLKDVGSEWVNGNKPDDDVTFVVIKVK